MKTKKKRKEKEKRNEGDCFHLKSVSILKNCPHIAAPVKSGGGGGGAVLVKASVVGVLSRLWG